MNPLYRDSHFSVRNPELETVIAKQSLPEQKSGRRRFDIHKNIESSGLYPNFTTRYPNTQDNLNSRSSIFTQSSKLNILNGPMNHILSQSELTHKKSSNTQQPIPNPNPNPNQKSPMLQNTMPSPQPPSISPRPHYSPDDEIEKLKEELFAKEQEIKNYQNLLQNSKDTINDQEILSSINKLEFDKKQIESRRKINSMSLDFQINEKNELKNKERERKEIELMKRLEMLRAMKEQDNKDMIEKACRAKEYKEQLDVQKYVKESMTIYRGKMINSPETEKKSSLFQFRPPNPFKASGSSENFSPSLPKFTKKAQRTISHDPITGKVQDASPYVFGQHPLISRKQLNPSLNNQDTSLNPQNNATNSPVKAQKNLANYGSMTLSSPPINS